MTRLPERIPIRALCAGVTTAEQLQAWRAEEARKNRTAQQERLAAENAAFRAALADPSSDLNRRIADKVAEAKGYGD